jgi:beta-lactamase regulating signal transducer with metallopeptidase domain
LVVVPTDRLLAFGVPGRSPQVVISAGLTRRLERDELEAVVVHEAAHLRLRHATVLSILLGIEAGFSVIPFVGRSIEAVRAALEVWADAAVPGSRSATHNPLRRALVDVTTANRCSSPNVDAETNDRVHRLARRARPQPALVRAAVYTPVAVLVLTAAALVAGWFTDAHHAVALGQPCTH